MNGHHAASRGTGPTAGVVLAAAKAGVAFIAWNAVNAQQAPLPYKSVCRGGGRPHSRKQARGLVPMQDMQRLDEAAFTEAAAGAPRTPTPVPTEPSRASDRATLSCASLWAFVLALIAMSAVVAQPLKETSGATTNRPHRARRSRGAVTSSIPVPRVHACARHRAGRRTHHVHCAVLRL